MKRKKMMITIPIIAVLITSAVLAGGGLIDGRLLLNPKVSSRADNVEFLNVTSAQGLTNAKGNYYQWVDWNNDGYIDLSVRGGTKLFRNNGPPDFDFTDVTASVGLSGGSTTGVWGDYDNDGDQDLYACRPKGSADVLWQNQGAPGYSMVDVTTSAGIPANLDPHMAAGWGDYDRDGYLDIYVVGSEDWNSGNPIYYSDILFHNDGDGTFTDVTVSAGVDTSASPIYGRGVQWADFDSDGWLDMYVSNYRLGANYLWQNNRDGTFTDVAKEYGAAGIGRSPTGSIPGAYYGHTIGSAFGDYNNDGNLDLFQANLVHKDPDRGKFCDDSHFYASDGGPFYHYTDKRLEMGIPFYAYSGTGYDPFDSKTYYKDELFSNLVFGDYDNDGWTDFYLPQVYDFPWTDCFLYRNNGNGTFTDVHDVKDIHSHNGYAGAWADTDNDGDLDLITYGKYPAHTSMVTRFFENNGTGNHWLHINLTADGVGNNLDAVGSRVTISYAGNTQMQDVTTSTGSHSAQNSKLLEFGLGTYTGNVEVEVWWPDGKVQRETVTGIDRVVNVTEAAGGPRITDMNTTAIINTTRFSDFDEDEMIKLSFTTTGSPPILKLDIFNNGSQINLSPSLPSIQAALHEPGRYTPKLTVWNSAGTVGDRQTIIINVNNLPPTAVANINSDAYETEEFTLNGSSSQDTLMDLGKLLYQWEYPNGTTTAWTNNPELKDSKDTIGKYDYILRVKDDQDVEDEDTIKVDVVNKPPEAAVQMTNDTFFEDEIIFFGGSGIDTEFDLSSLLFSWDFDDGTQTAWVGTASTNYSFSRNGTYNVTFRVKDNDDAVTQDWINISILNRAPVIEKLPDTLIAEEDESIVFTATVEDTPSDQTSLEYRWEFGDGDGTGWDTSSTASHKYTNMGAYTATLFARDDDLNLTSGTVQVHITNPAPFAMLVDTEVEMTVTEGDLVTLKGTGTDTASDSPGLECRWVFGDGMNTSWGDTKEVMHYYNSSGTFTALFFVRDDNLAQENASVRINVMNAAPEILDNSYSPAQPSVDEPVTFTVQAGDTLNDEPGLNYTWKIDGIEHYGSTVEHVFLSGGSKSAGCTVTDDDGESAEVGFKLNIVNPAPQAALEANRTALTEGGSVTFSATGTDNPSDAGSLVFFWDLGDGKEVQGGPEMNHTFSSAGTYTVIVHVQDDERARGSAQVKITVTGKEVPPVLDDDDEDDDNDTGKERNSLLYVGVIVAVLALVLVAAVVVIVVSKKRPPVETPPEDDEE